MTAQLLALFAFGLVMTGVVLLGIIRAREIAERAAKVQAADRHRESSVRRAHFGDQRLRKAS